MTGKGAGCNTGVRGEEGGQVKFYLYKKGSRGRRKGFSHTERGGTKDFKVVLTWVRKLYGVEQLTGEGTKPCITRAVSKSDSDYGSGYYGHRTLGLMAMGSDYYLL